MRHASRTHSVDFFLKILDPCISGWYVNTNQQIVDILTTGSFTLDKMEWAHGSVRKIAL